MKRPNTRRSLNPAMAIGLVTLVAASGFKYLVDSRLGAAATNFDLVLGLLYGASFGALLLGLRAQTRNSPIASRAGQSDPDPS